MHFRTSSVIALAGLLALASGCSAAADGPGEGDDAATASDARAVFEIHPLDIWAQALPDGDAKLVVKKDGKTLKTAHGTTNVYVAAKGSYQVHLEAPMHEPLDVTID